MSNMKLLAWLVLVALVVAVGRNGAAQTASASSQEKADSKAEGSASSSAKGGPEASARAAQTTSAASQQDVEAQRDVAQLRAGTKISTELETALDASKAKPGDEVVAKVTKDVKEHGKAVIRKGDRLIGRVNSVEGNAQGQGTSQVSVMFDQLARGDARYSLNTAVSSIVSTSGDRRGMDEPMMPSEPMMASPQAEARSAGSASSNGGMLGGVTSAAGSTVNAAASAAGRVGSAAGSAANSTLGGAGGALGVDSRATGQGNAAAGLSTPSREIRVGTSAGANQSSDAASVLSSRHGNFRLDSGTQMRFRVAAQSETKAHKQ
ncbi:MAG: hypothetical protein ACE145_05630 [Terriglobia bacterium]